MEQKQKIEFDFPVLQVVENLIGDAIRSVFNRPKFLHIFDVEIRDAPPFDFSSGSEFLERLDRLGKLRVSFSPMQKVKIDCVDSEAFETALTCFWQFRARSVMRIHLGDNDNAIALILDCIAHNL